MAALLLKELGVASPYANEVVCPQPVEIAMRVKDGRRWCILLNYVNSAQACALKGAWTGLDGKPVKGEVRLDAYGVLVLRQDTK